MITIKPATPLAALILASAAAAALLSAACNEAAEPSRVELPVTTDSAEVVPVQTDLGYVVSLTSARLVMRDLVFTIAGEAHTELSAFRLLHDLLIPPAHAHPGHYLGGEVTGELLGRHVLDLTTEGSVVGMATLLEGTYTAANFTFARGTVDDGLEATDPLIGHTAILEGIATRDGDEYSFVVVLDSPEDRVLVGAPFEARVAPGAASPIRFAFAPRDELEGDTLFDGIDFAVLDADGDGTVSLAADAADSETEDAYNRIHRVFQSHDHFALHLD
jgi:hypothetical protein